MPRNRIIKPEFWEDEKISELSMAERLLFISMWNFADDEGYLPCKRNWLKIKCFPYDTDITPEDIKDMVEKLKAKGFIYSSNEILWIKSFVNHQKIDRPKPSVLRSSYLGTPTMVNPGKPSMKSRSSNQARNKNESLKESFELLWREYPKKDGKKNALKSFISSVTTEEDYHDIQLALSKYKKYIEITNTKYQFIKNGSTWFSNWKDWIEVDIEPIIKENKTKEESNSDIIRDFAMGNGATTTREPIDHVRAFAGDVSIEEGDEVYDAVVVHNDSG